MKIFKLILFLFFVSPCLLVTQSCKDECENIACQNGGTCIDGTCDCPEGTNGTNCENFDSEFVQTLLNAGNTPMELINGNIPVDSLYGKTYEGGYIFYIDLDDILLNVEGMVAAPLDQSIGASWGCVGSDILGVSNVTSVNPETQQGGQVGDGKDNTNAIFTECLEVDIAAKLCANLILNNKEDWFLPSREELNLMWINLADSDRDGINLGSNDPNNIGGFDVDLYWSSSEVVAFHAWYQGFNNGGQSFGEDKSNSTINVRAVRTF